MNAFIIDLLAGIQIALGIAKPAKTGRVTEDLSVVKAGTANFYIVRKGGCCVAFDAGYGAPVIRRELGKLGISPDHVSALFLSHSDFDHMGGRAVFPNAKIYLSRDEEQMITRKTARKYGFVYNGGIERPYTLLGDGDEVNIGPIAVRAVGTPGHTPGSMSYLIDGKILFVGDACRVVKGRVRPVHRFFCMDRRAQDRSIRKLAALAGVELTLTGHRGHWGDFSSAAGEWR